MVLFDIETGSQPEDDIAHLFDPDSVKLGNLKDPDKIDAKIEEARKGFFEKAALSPLTGQVLAIGLMYEESDEPETHADDDRIRIDCVDSTTPEEESRVLDNFWKNCLHCSDQNFIGFNTNSFDLPFMARRSWLLGVDVPSELRQTRYWSNQFVDLLDVWRLGDRNLYVSLDAIDQALGGTGKPDGLTGADFARLFFGTAEERSQSLDYLKNDLEMLGRVAEALQVL